MRSPAQLRAIFASYARRGFPQADEGAMAARTKVARRLRTVRRAVRFTRKELGGRTMKPMPATRELDAHILQMRPVKVSRIVPKIQVKRAQLADAARARGDLKYNAKWRSSSSSLPRTLTRYIKKHRI